MNFINVQQHLVQIACAFRIELKAGNGEIVRNSRRSIRKKQFYQIVLKGFR